MLALKHFRDTAPALPDLLNWAALRDSGLVQCKDGSLLAGWYLAGPDVASSTGGELEHVTERVNVALARLGAGWAMWVEAVRLPAASYPPPSASHFPDPVSRLVDDERRRQFEAEGAHFDTEYALILQYTPPLRSHGRIVDMMHDDDETSRESVATRIIAKVEKDLGDFEDAIAGAVRLRRMGGFVAPDPAGRGHLRDELVNYLHFALTGEPLSLNIPPHGAYLDAFVGGRDFWPGYNPRMGDERIACVAIEGFPAQSTPMLLDALQGLAIPFRWSSRFIWLDQHEALGELKKLRRKWKVNVRGFFSQVFKTVGGPVNEDALLMVQETETAIANANSGLVAFGYYTPVIVLRNSDAAQLLQDARTVVQATQSIGFAARVEDVNTTEAWLGSLPGHPVPNIRRPLFHTLNLADLLPLSSVWTGADTNPCPFYPAGSPPLLHAATTGATPFRLNLHVADVGHTLIFGPTGAGKSTLLCTVAIQALRYPGATICAFDKGRSMLATVLACGGRHYDIGAQGSPAFCPLSVLDTEGDVAWAEDWIATCFELQAGHAPRPSQRDAIHRAIRLIREPGSERSLTHFTAQVQDEEIRDALRFYTLEGAAGHLLDAERDGIAESHFTVFEIGELMGMGERTLIPVLLHLFRRFERSLRGQPAFLTLDEAWVMLGHAVFHPKIRQWLKELRKANCAVILATQSLSDAMRSGLLDVLIESCPTKIYLPNEEAMTEGTEANPGPRDFYRAQGLNDTQIEIIRSAVKKRHYYAVSPEGRRLFDLSLGPIALSFVGVSDPEQIEHVKALAERHGERWPFARLEERGIEYQNAQEAAL